MCLIFKRLWTKLLWRPKYYWHYWVSLHECFLVFFSFILEEIKVSRTHSALFSVLLSGCLLSVKLYFHTILAIFSPYLLLNFLYLVSYSFIGWALVVDLFSFLNLTIYTLCWFYNFSATLFSICLSYILWIFFFWFLNMIFFIISLYPLCLISSVLYLCCILTILFISLFVVCRFFSEI